MKVTVIFVTTLDGKITKWGDPHVQRWSSKEDQLYFKTIWAASPLIVIGSSTFAFDPIKPSPNNRLIVMTHELDTYAAYRVAGQVEFTKESPKEIVARCKQEGYEAMLVVGGPHVATSFFKAGLVDELWLTLEPKIFGSGGNFVVEAQLDIALKLISVEKVNDQGTLITKYEVLH